MFKLDADNSIHITRGDMAFLKITANKNGEPYTFQPGEVLRIKVYGKKDAENVVLQKDFHVTAVTQYVEMVLNGNDTKIGEVISKPKDYWYEVELNPYDNPQTILGYGEDGPLLFKLYPEGKDIPEIEPDPEVIRVIDTELDMTSERPVQNQVIARAITRLQGMHDVTRVGVTKHTDVTLSNPYCTYNAAVVTFQVKVTCNSNIPAMTAIATLPAEAVRAIEDSIYTYVPQMSAFVQLNINADGTITSAVDMPTGTEFVINYTAIRNQ